MAVAKKTTAAKPRTRAAKTAAPSSGGAGEGESQTVEAPVGAADGAKATSAPRPAVRTAATATVLKNTSTTSKSDASDTTKPEAEKPVQSSPKTDQKTSQKSEESGNRISVTIPLDSAAVGLAVKAATLPVTAVKKVAQNRNGIPAYVAVGGLAVIGAVEWPVAAVGGLGLAALRRWGPLKPAPDSKQVSKQESKQDSKKSA